MLKLNLKKFTSNFLTLPEVYQGLPHTSKVKALQEGFQDSILYVYGSTEYASVFSNALFSKYHSEKRFLTMYFAALISRNFLLQMTPDFLSLIFLFFPPIN